MSTVRERALENATGIVSILIFGAGLVALFAGVNLFWIVWTLGFPILLPLVASLTSDNENQTDMEDESHRPTERSEHETTTALETLRERYARGDLTDKQFERKLDALLETESPENAAEWRTRERLEEES
jgi:uncharacterized membrane protein